MNIEILDKRENQLLGRTQVKFKIIHNGEPIPTRGKMKNILSNTFQVPESNVIISYAKTQFGINETLGYAKIYNDKDLAIKLEPKYILKRNGLIETEEKKE